jgi:hypothetical protein
MNGTLLIGRNVKVRANDFIQMDLAARITYVSEHDRKLLLDLGAPITISGVTYTHAVASPRLARDDLNVLLSNGVLGCAVTWVSKERFDLNKPLDLTWWRGGAAVITDVMLQNSYTPRGQVFGFLK